MAGITTGADGSINIDTKIDASGVNKGTQQINKAVEKNVAKPVQSLTKSMGGILNVIKSIGKALIVAFIGGSIISAIRNIVQEFDFLTGSSGDKFKALSGAIDTLKGAFVNLLVQAFIPMIPTLIKIIDFLTEMVQTATQIVAAFFGADKTVGGIMTKAAAGAKKAAKEAKGALAAFDQINVLQQKQDNAPEGMTATPGPITIDSDILKKVADLKKLWDEFLKDPWGVLSRIALAVIEDIGKAWEKLIQWVRDNLPFGDVIADILTIIGDTFKKLVVNAIETFLKIKENVLLVFTGIKEFLIGVFTGDWAMIWQGLKDIVAGVFGALLALVEGIAKFFLIAFQGMVEILKVLFAPVIEWLQEMFDRIRAKVGDAIASIQTAFALLAKWFVENVWVPIEIGFGSMLVGLKLGFERTFNGIKDFVKGTINSIIDFLNRMIDAVVGGINSVIGAANAIAGIAGVPEISPIVAPKIPRLATGAVIPPNSEFLAVLGDQKSGRNIEAPEGLLRQIIAEQLGSMQADVRVTFEGSLGALVRELKPHIDAENVRVGGSLIRSGKTS